jgi:hypothetical protein
MAVIAVILGVLLIVVVLFDVFEAVVLPRRVTRRLRLTKLLYRASWVPWSALARRIHNESRRETVLSYYGPASLIMLLVVWALGLIVGFGLLHRGLATGLALPDGTHSLGTDLYMSGTTLFTLGLGDVLPHTATGRLLTVVESGTGLALLAIVIGYVPTLYQTFSRREADIALLDARAGSPPCAAEMLRRYARAGDLDELGDFLHEWEHWVSELLESHLSYPLLAYYRSQHDNQSWLAALTAILDLCALALVGVDGMAVRPARLTFAMARHAAVDLGQVFGARPESIERDRLPEADLVRLRAELEDAGVKLREGEAADLRLSELRRLYEPYVVSLSHFLQMPLPPWLPPADRSDDWLRSAWEKEDERFHL